MFRSDPSLQDSPSFRPSINPSVFPASSLEWSKGTDAGGPLRIQFPYRWDTQRGPAFDWYRRQPTTCFRTLQYRKERQKPFCHEFIMVKLVDGPICRFERMGDPDAPTKAVTRTGSVAYDIVQYFVKLELEKVDEESDVVAEIEFSCEFDLLDVLSICYAISKTTRRNNILFNVTIAIFSPGPLCPV
jgi:hypothetical protein